MKREEMEKAVASFFERHHDPYTTPTGPWLHYDEALEMALSLVSQAYDEAAREVERLSSMGYGTGWIIREPPALIASRIRALKPE